MKVGHPTDRANTARWARALRNSYRRAGMPRMNEKVALMIERRMMLLAQARIDIPKHQSQFTLTPA